MKRPDDLDKVAIASAVVAFGTWLLLPTARWAAVVLAVCAVLLVLLPRDWARR